jgi:hypothetical protein
LVNERKSEERGKNETARRINAEGRWASIYSGAKMLGGGRLEAFSFDGIKRKCNIR